MKAQHTNTSAKLAKKLFLFIKTSKLKTAFLKPRQPEIKVTLL
ncbi:hypothetical protein SAMN04488024_102276 [Pedobacter soli]|uniref:Uncharacterized protein n=1 Tax=Pedobacter soli TaxID=390242 RepID=A0A1G6MAF5_9SPHI|nr:hypothetical protein SAMN04488024_102276 [Pedobacter soli]